MSACGKVLWLAATWLALCSGRVRAEETAASRARADRGFSYRREVVAEVPWSINILRISRTNTTLELHTSLGGGRTIGISTINEQVAGFPKELGKAVAAINGDYFVRRGAYEGDPESLQIFGGELVSAPSGKSCFWIDSQGQPHITNVVSKLELTWLDGTVVPLGLNEARDASAAVLYTPVTAPHTQTGSGPEFVLEPTGEGPWLPLRAGTMVTARIAAIREAGDTPVPPKGMVLSLGATLARRLPSASVGGRVKISTATLPDMQDVRTAIGGGPAILRAGKITDFKSENVRHPRSAVGFNRDAIFFVQVDGRQRDHSVGMTLQELAERMRLLGCEEALNLDGGGSSTLWMLGQLVNSPSQGAERRTGNSLVLVQKERPAP